jgi:hypothetical protein
MAGAKDEHQFFCYWTHDGSRPSDYERGGGRRASELLQDHQLPKIYHDDPAVKEIGAKINDVIRIVRNSQTAGRAEAYRQVVKRPKK